MQIVSISSHRPTQPYYMLDAFIASCQRFGHNPVILSEGYGGLGTKPVMLRKWIQANRDEYIVFTDSWDVVFQRELDIPVVNKLVFNAEKALFPFSERMADAFPDPKTPYRYLNSGFSFGPTELYLQAINSMPQERLVPDKQLPSGAWDNPNDQEFWQIAYLHGNVPMALDTHAEFAQTLSGVTKDELDFREPLIKNKELGTIPIAIHVNGRKEDWKDIILDHLNLPK